MLVLKEVKHKREAKTEIVFKNVNELKDYLNKAKIYSAGVIGPEFQCGFESGGLVEFHYGGSTLLFTKGGYFARVIVSHIKSMYKIKDSNTLVIETKKGGMFSVICEPKK
jgi:hypothetical protein